MSRKRPFPASIRPARETESGVSIPAADLRVGEIAVNSADGTVFVKREDGSVVAISGEGGGTGPVGPAGPQGPQGDRGFGAFEFTTERVGEEQYKAGEIVYFGGAYYVCLADNDAITPTSSIGVYWDAYSFVGPQGPAGSDGAPGPGADQSLNTTDTVAFQGVDATTFHAGSVHFDDGTIQTTAYTGGGASYDQSLNTTDSVAFTGLVLNANGCGGSAVSFAFDPQPYVTIQDGNCEGSPLGNPLVLTGSGITFPDGTTQTTAGGGSSYDQSLNTTDSVAFAGVVTTSLQSGISGPVGIYSDVSIPSHGISFADGKRQTVACPLYREHEGSRTYQSGDVVVYDGAMYRCNSPGAYQNSAPPTMDGTWVAISGPPGPPGNPFDQDLNTQNGVQFSSVSFPDGTQMTTASAPLPPIDQNTGNGYTLLWNPNGSPGWTYSRDTSNGTSLTWDNPNAPMGLGALNITNSSGTMSYAGHGVRFPDGTFQTTAYTGGGGGGTLPNATASGRLLFDSPDSLVEWTEASSVVAQFTFTDAGYGIKVRNIGTNHGPEMMQHGFTVPLNSWGYRFPDGVWQTTAMPTPYNEGSTSNDGTLLYSGISGETGNPAWLKTNYGSFGMFFREDSSGAGAGVAFGHGAGNTQWYNGGCVFISSSHGRIYIGTDTMIGAYGVTLPGQELTLLNLPTTDPVVAGRVWNDNGVLKVSAG